MDDANRQLALLFKTLATLRIDAALFDDVDALRWSGATPGFAAIALKFGDTRLGERVLELERRVA